MRNLQTKRKRIPYAAAAAAILVLSLVTAGCGGSGGGSGGGASSQTTSSTTLVGAGSTLVAPLLTDWQSDYASKTSTTVTYGAIGSGGGIDDISAGQVDFGASDAPLTHDQAAGCKGCVLVPWALAATTISYNVPGVSKPLRLTGSVIAGMYLGTIKTWNDAAIRKLNPGVNLPSTPIKPIYRSDASGDTYAFTDYLSHVSPGWKKVGGASTEISWPTGTGAAHNSGVAAAIESTPGAVGYVAIGQAVGSQLHYGAIQNAAGAYILPSTQSIAAAASSAHFASDNSASIVDPPASAKSAYPISTFTYAIVSRNSSKLASLKRFLTYAVTTGQSFAAKLEFAPLPKNVVAKDKAIINGL